MLLSLSLDQCFDILVGGHLLVGKDWVRRKTLVAINPLTVYTYVPQSIIFYMGQQSGEDSPVHPGEACVAPALCRRRGSRSPHGLG